MAVVQRVPPVTTDSFLESRIAPGQAPIVVVSKLPFEVGRDREDRPFATVALAATAHTQTLGVNI